MSGRVFNLPYPQPGRAEPSWARATTDADAGARAHMLSKLLSPMMLVVRHYHVEEQSKYVL